MSSFRRRHRRRMTIGSLSKRCQASLKMSWSQRAKSQNLTQVIISSKKILKKMDKLKYKNQLEQRLQIKLRNQKSETKKNIII